MLFVKFEEPGGISWRGGKAAGGGTAARAQHSRESRGCLGSLPAPVRSQTIHNGGLLRYGIPPRKLL